MFDVVVTRYGACGGNSSRGITLFLIVVVQAAAAPVLIVVPPPAWVRLVLSSRLRGEHALTQLEYPTGSEI